MSLEESIGFHVLMNFYFLSTALQKCIAITEEISYFNLDTECLTKKNKRLSFKVIQLDYFFISDKIKLIEY